MLCEFKINSARVSGADRFAPSYRNCLSPYQYLQLVLFLNSYDRYASSCLVTLLTFEIISLAERYSPKPFKVFVIVYEIISVTGRPTSSCFQVISLAGRFAASSFVTVPLFNIISVVDLLPTSCYFVELFARLISTLRFAIVLSALSRFK